MTPAAPTDPVPFEKGGQQPWLHDLVAAVAAPTALFSARSGDIHPGGAQGVWHGDIRVLTRADLSVNASRPVPVAGGSARAGRAQFTSFVRSLNAGTPDPTARINRVRTVSDGTVSETIELSTSTPGPARAEIVLRLAADLQRIEIVKSGRGANVPARPGTLLDNGRGVRWNDDETTVTVEATGEPQLHTDGDEVRITWQIDLAGPGSHTVSWRLQAESQKSPVAAAVGDLEWSSPMITAGDRRLPAFVDQSLADLAGLRMRLQDGTDTFLAAGAPWYFTLFGRDSIWAVRMLLPLGTDLAAQTLRTLAALQGKRVDDETAEAPGKIMHEIRGGHFAAGDDTVLPPLYYGTVDATPLWICLLHDAWRWGMAAEQVEELLPNLESALAWMAEFGDSDGDGFLEYVDVSGHGLANQGWKDSGDSIRFASGAQADPPVVLSEVQGYAYEAAIGGADLLDAFGRTGADAWRTWANELANRFRHQFWVSDSIGPYPALALDADKRPVDSLTSNIGHLLGTGLLNAEETAQVVDRLTRPDMDSGFGLRTMSTESAAFSTHSYHCGSVWPHDTAIVIRGMAAAGYGEQAAGLIDGLLAAASHFDYRLPELFGGDARTAAPYPIPYPAACRPQAWSAAASVAVLTAVLGLAVDAPSKAVRLDPIRPSPVGALKITGLRIGSRDLSVDVAENGDLRAPLEDPFS